MKKALIFALSSLLTIGLFTSTASANACGDAMQAASEAAAKDKDCQKDAKNIFKALGKQFGICKAFREKLKTCRIAKRNSGWHCRNAAKTGRRGCRHAKRQCLSKCPKWRKGRNCRRNCRHAKRSCMSAMRTQKKNCHHAKRQTKRACKSQAKASSAFAVCKNARKLTGRAAGNAAKCAAKYYSKAAGVCISQLFQN